MGDICETSTLALQPEFDSYSYCIVLLALSPIYSAMISLPLPLVAASSSVLFRRDSHVHDA